MTELARSSRERLAPAVLLLATAALYLAEGIYHSYYTVALAPGVAALVGIGGGLLWRLRGPGAPRQPSAGGQQRGPGRNSEIVTWVQENFESTTVGDRTVYDFANPTS